MSCSSLGLRQSTQVRHVLISDHTCNPYVYPQQVEWTTPAFTRQPQNISALWLVLISCPAEGTGVWVGLGGLVKYCGDVPARRRSLSYSISCGGRESNTRPSSCEPDPLTTTQPSQTKRQHDRKKRQKQYCCFRSSLPPSKRVRQPFLRYKFLALPNA